MKHHITIIRVAALIAATAFVAVLSSVVIASAATITGRPFTVRSTLAGKTVLPHRIHWLGMPSIASAKVSEVDFLIDGKLAWVEHHAPYTYGFDGNYLVTSWLTPAVHRFMVRAIATDGRRATTSTSARVLPASPPPAALDGSWKRVVTKAEAGSSGPPGVWRLTVSTVGWRLRDPRSHGALVDVAYLSADLLEARGGIATTDRSPQEGNIWCTEPFQPVRYHWAVKSSLIITLAGPKRCDGQSGVWAGVWTRT